jgi:hypothetical protein
MRLTTGGQPVGREGVERNGTERGGGRGREGRAGRLGYATLGQDVGGRTGRGPGEAVTQLGG